MKGMSPEEFARTFGLSPEKVRMYCKQSISRIKDCKLRFAKDDVIFFGERTPRIIVEFQGKRMVRPRLVERTAKEGSIHVPG